MGRSLKLTCIRTLNFTKVFVQLHTRLKFPVYLKIIILSNWCSILLYLKESHPNLNELVLTLGHNFNNDLSMYIPNNVLCLLLIGFVSFLLFFSLAVRQRRRPCTNIIICVYNKLAAYLFSSTFSVLRKAQPSTPAQQKKVKYFGTLLQLKLGIIPVISVKYSTKTKIFTVIKQKVISYYYNLINFFQYIGLKLKTKIPKTYKIILNILYFIKILSFLLAFSFIVLTILYLLGYVYRPQRYTVFSVFFFIIADALILIDYWALDFLHTVFGFRGFKAAGCASLTRETSGGFSKISLAQPSDKVSTDSCSVGLSVEKNNKFFVRASSTVLTHPALSTNESFIFNKSPWEED